MIRSERARIGGAEAMEDKVEEENRMETIKLASASHVIEDDFLEYVGSYRVNAAFKPAKSHAGEVELLSTYAPDEEYGREGSVPYIAVQEDDDVFCAIEEFQEDGTFEGALEIEALSGKYLFRAKQQYYGDMMYFYGFACEDGYWQQAGLCLVYPKEYAGTEDEKKLMEVLDEAAESFRLERAAGRIQ